MVFRHLRAAAAFLLLVLLVDCAAAAVPRARMRNEAYVGDPFGVGCLEIPLSESSEPEPLGWAGLGISEKRHRALYPATESRSLSGLVDKVLEQSQRPAARVLGEVLEGRGRARIYFLFTGRGPLELVVQSRQAQALTLMPVENPAAHRRLLETWWRHYTARPGLLRSAIECPPVVENYLRAMLARRLGLTLPERPRTQSWQEQLSGELSLLAGTESLRLAIQRDRFLKAPSGKAPSGIETADEPLPEAVALEEPEVPEVAADVQVEPLAQRVPAECFYVRFGSFSNFLWLQDTLERIGGDFQNLVASRGLDRGTRQRFETQLAVETTALARLLGDTLIADVAIVGSDFFLQEGGAYGLLFQAKNNLLLGGDFVRQRAERAAKMPGVSLQQVKIDGRDVSLLSSPDGRVRSYYAADGDYHFITTSKGLVQRFFATRSGQTSLGASREFRYARSVLSLGRKDTVFVYLSSALLRHLASPAYRIEMGRRLEALADLELVQLATLASATEGKPGETIEDLVAGRFLPAGFGPRADGSRTVLEGGEVRDSLRGERGAFVPIPDVEVSRVSRSEAAMYRQFSDFLRSQWGRLDPVLIGIQRQALDKDRDRVTVDLRVTPLAQSHVQRLARFLGPADKQRLPRIAGDSAALELILPGQRVFGGLQQVGPGVQTAEGGLLPLGRLRDLLVGYLGSSDEMGLLRWVPFRSSTPPDAQGYTRGDLGLWRTQTERFTVFSFHREVLDKVVPQLRLEEAERPAQVRLRVDDLSKSPMASFVNGLGYSRSRETSLGNVRLMHQMTQQLHIPAGDARTAAEVILDAKLVCPLGGEYVFREGGEGAGHWTSTALEGTRRRGLLSLQAPEGYLAPPLTWFRGLELEAALGQNALSAHIQLDMQWPKR